MSLAAAYPRDDLPDLDGRVIMHGVSWWQLEAMLAIRGDQAGVRVAYLEGDLEIISPSRSHEYVKTFLARLLEAYAEETGLLFEGYGSLTIKNAPRERAAEPDECYVVGSRKETPDLVIEVIWTSGGLNKHKIYSGLGVQELWEWRRGKIAVLQLQGDSYHPAARSALLPNLDLEWLVSFLDMDDQTAAVRAFRKALRGG